MLALHQALGTVKCSLTLFSKRLILRRLGEASSFLSSLVQEASTSSDGRIALWKRKEGRRRRREEEEEKEEALK